MPWYLHFDCAYVQWEKLGISSTAHTTLCYNLVFSQFLQGLYCFPELRMFNTFLLTSYPYVHHELLWSTCSPFSYSSVFLHATEPWTPNNVLTFIITFPSESVHAPRLADLRYRNQDLFSSQLAATVCVYFSSFSFGYDSSSGSSNCCSLSVPEWHSNVCHSFCNTESSNDPPLLWTKFIIATFFKVLYDQRPVFPRTAQGDLHGCWLRTWNNLAALEWDWLNLNLSPSLANCLTSVALFHFHLLLISLSKKCQILVKTKSCKL